MTQKNVIVIRKSPIKIVVKENIKVSDTNFEIQQFLTNRILKVAYDIKIDISP